MSPKMIAVGLFIGALAFQSSFADDPGQLGSWQKHTYNFRFLGFTSTYSCDGLADKLRILLLAAGARPDVKSSPGACVRGYGSPDKFAQATLTFYTLAPSSDAGSGSTSVVGSWRPVAFASRSPRELATGDCELVEQFRDSVLPMLSVRNLENHVTCVPHQQSGSVIDLKFESFQAAKPEKASAK